MNQDFFKVVRETLIYITNYIDTYHNNFDIINWIYLLWNRKFSKNQLTCKKNENQNFQAMKILNEYKKLYPTILL